MRIKLLGLSAAVALVAIVGGCGSSKGKSASTSSVPRAATTATGATTTPASPTTGSSDTASTTTTPAEAEETGDAIALSAALGNDLTGDDAECIKQTVGDSTVALLDENDIGALPANVEGDLFQAMAKCAHDTIVDNLVTVLPGLLDVTEDQASCVGEAFVKIYSENRKAAEQGATTFDEKDPDVQSYIRDKLGACMPADKVDEFLTQQAG